MSVPDARRQLAAQQAALMAALAGRGDAPAGFDAERVQASAAALVSKRIRAAARVWPALAGALGETFAPRFRAFAQATPLPAEGGPLADGWHFARTIHAELPDAARREVLGVRLRFRATATGLVRRRGPALGCAWLPQGRVVVLAMRLPGLGDWWLALPVPFLRAPKSQTALAPSQARLRG